MKITMKKMTTAAARITKGNNMTLTGLQTRFEVP